MQKIHSRSSATDQESSSPKNRTRGRSSGGSRDSADCWPGAETCCGAICPGAPGRAVPGISAGFGCGAVRRARAAASLSAGGIGKPFHNVGSSCGVICVCGADVGGPPLSAEDGCSEPNDTFDIGSEL